jgi:signal peptide peptidase SppA
MCEPTRVDPGASGSAEAPLPIQAQSAYIPFDAINGVSMGLFRRAPVLPVLRFSGAIGMAAPLRPGLSLATSASAIERAFKMSKIPAVAVMINSPGGSPVQSHLIFQRIRALAVEHKKRVHVFCEDVAASGGYFLAIAGDEIYADPSSIIGSIGVISSGFGFDKAIEKLGIERRVHTAGLSKSTLDPFLPEKPEDIARLKELQRDVHDVFISFVKDRRAGKLRGQDSELFSGAFWSATRALDHGLIDGIGDPRTRMRDLYGQKIQLVVVPMEKPGLLSRLRRIPAMQSPVSSALDLALSSQPSTASLADDVLASIETRALWARYGL